MLAYCVISAYAWAGFPYDNLCIDENYADGGANGTYTNVVFRNTTRRESVEVKPEDAYKFCRQSFTGFDGLLFPPTSRIQSATKQWMQNSQETLTDLYGWTSVVAVTVYVLVYFGTAIFNALLSWIQGVYEPQGQEQHIDFSSDYGKLIT